MEGNQERTCKGWKKRCGGTNEMGEWGDDIQMVVVVVVMWQ